MVKSPRTLSCEPTAASSQNAGKSSVHLRNVWNEATYWEKRDNSVSKMLRAVRTRGACSDAGVAV